MSSTTTKTTTTTLNETVSGSKKIKAIVLTSTGGGSDYSNLKIKDEDYPVIDESIESHKDHIIVRIKATGLNFAELMQRQGMYRPATKCPYTPGYEAAGIVEQVGSGVTEFKVNDRVMVFGSSGMWKEVVSVAKTNVIRMPDEMSFEDGASLLINYLTAYQVLFRIGNLKAGETVLIHMAAGGVGTAAIQLCKTVPGVIVIGTASSAKHDFIKELGVTHAIDYNTSDYVNEIKKLCPNGVDIVMDPLNGENSIKGYNLLKPFGRIIHFGAASISSGESRSLVNAFKTWWKCLTVNALDIMSENKSVSGYHLGHLITNPVCRPEILADLKTLLQLYAKGAFKIKVDSIFSYSRIGEAMKRMHTRGNFGKVLLKPDCEIAPPAATEQVQIVTTVITTPVTTPTTPNGGELPTIKPLQVNGGTHTTTTTITSTTTSPTKETLPQLEKISNGINNGGINGHNHHVEEKTNGDVEHEEETSMKKHDVNEEVQKSTEMNGKHIVQTEQDLIST